MSQVATLPPQSAKVYEALKELLTRDGCDFGDGMYSSVNTKDLAKHLGQSTQQVAGTLSHLEGLGFVIQDVFGDGSNCLQIDEGA